MVTTLHNGVPIWKPSTNNYLHSCVSVEDLEQSDFFRQADKVTCTNYVRTTPMLTCFHNPFMCNKNVTQEETEIACERTITRTETCV